MNQQVIEHPSNRRLARFSVTPEVFLCLGSGWFEVISNPLPADARITSCFYDDARGCFTVVLTSESFDWVIVGDVIPDVPAPVIRRIEAAGGVQ